MAWPPKARAARSVRRSAALSLVLSALLVGCVAGPALAAPNNEANKDRLDSTVRFLESAQNSDGGFSANGDPGEPSDTGITAWTAIGLAAAGINPQNQARPGGESAFGYLAEHASSLAATNEFERVLLVVDAAGTAPQDFGGVDLTQAILRRQLPGGGFSPEEGGRKPSVNDTVFAILALSPVQEAPAQEAVKSAVEWLEAAQNTDGSWPVECPRNVPGCGSGSPGEVDMTAAAVEALNAAEAHDAEAQHEAFRFLRAAQDPDGGFPEFMGEAEANTASTSWTVQAIWSAGENPETWTAKGSDKEPLGYLEAMQHEDGSIQWDASSDPNTVWMTAYAAPAFSGEPLPPPVVPPPVPSSTPPGGDGVVTGGGGEGAPLFSRPQPQSTGETPGGARLLHGRHRRAGKHAREPDPHRRAAALAIKAPAASRPAAPDQRDRRRGTGSGSASPTVTGLLLNASDDTPLSDAQEAGAPGLRSAGASAGAGRWLAIAIGGLIVVLILAGAQLERRRPRVIL